MPAANTPTSLIGLVASELASIGPTGFGGQDSARHQAPRRFVWVPIDSPLRGPRRSSKNGEHVIDAVGLRFAVECWGHTFDDAFALVTALLTALQRAWAGRQYTTDQMTPGGQHLVDHGFALTVQVEIEIDLIALDLSQPLPVPAARAAFDAETPEGGLQPIEEPPYGPTGETTAPIQSVAQATPAESTPDDGWLESEET